MDHISEGSDSDEDYNLRNFGIYQALPVEGEPDWSLEEPDSAEEYLRRVRHEAARCARVVRAQYEPPPVDSNDDSSSPPDPDAADNSTSSAISSAAGAPRRGKLLQLLDPDTIPDAPDWARPCPDWVKRFVTDFQQLRQQVGERYETGEDAADVALHINDWQGWERLCFGPAAAAEAAESGEAAAASAGAGAELTCMSQGIYRTLMALDQVAVVELLQRHTEQLLELHPADLPLIRAQWLFALATRVEKPAQPAVGASFRALLRHCCRLRAGLKQASDPLLPQLNVLITVAGAYFGQDEQLCRLVDSLELY